MGLKVLSPLQFVIIDNSFGILIYLVTNTNVWYCMLHLIYFIL